MSRLALAPVWLMIFAYVHAMRMLTSRPVATTARTAMALAVALAAYLLVMLPAIHTVPPQAGHAATAYACAMAVATLAATSIAGLVLPRRAREIGMALCAGLAIAYPALVALSAEPGTPVRLMQSLYLSASALGGWCAVNWGLAALHRLAPAWRPVAS